MIVYHIYRENGRDWVIKDAKKTDVVYTMRSEYHVTKSHRRLLYRGLVHTGSCVAIIELLESSKHPTLKLYQTGEIISMNGSEISTKRLGFRYNDRDFVWTNETKLTDSTGKVIALFERKRFSWKKLGRLTIENDEIGMRDVIMATAIAVQFYWREVMKRQGETNSEEAGERYTSFKTQN